MTAFTGYIDTIEDGLAKFRLSGSSNGGFSLTRIPDPSPKTNVIDAARKNLTTF